MASTPPLPSWQGTALDGKELQTTWNHKERVFVMDNSLARIQFIIGMSLVDRPCDMVV